MENDKQHHEEKHKSQIEETGITPKHDKASDIGAGRQIGDERSGTLSDRAGDEGFDDDTIIRSEGDSPGESLDDL